MFFGRWTVGFSNQKPFALSGSEHRETLAVITLLAYRCHDNHALPVCTAFPDTKQQGVKDCCSKDRGRGPQALAYY